MKIHKGFEKSTAAFLIIILLFSLFSLYTTASAIDPYDFANLTEADAVAFVEQNNINIPEEFLQLEDFPDFTKRLILQAYNYPNVAFCFNYDVTQEYAEEIRAAVISYMNLGAVPAIASATSYSLLYNKVRDENGNWVTSGGYYNEKWRHYNCYAFSINRAEQPSFYNTEKQYQPGDMSGAGIFDYCNNVGELAEIVRADIEAMGYSNILVSSTIPAVDLSQELICVRILSGFDYHFMRYDIDTDAWYHKPDLSSVLKYNYVPSNDLLWYSEYSNSYGEYPSTFAYDSDIIFIRYDKNQINVNDYATSREYIQQNKDAFCELNFANSGNCEISLISTASIRYEIYDEDFDIISYGNGADNDITVNLDAGKYYLRMNFDSYNSLNYVDISIHMHSYTHHYGQLSSTQHKLYCECGEYTVQAHNFSQYINITDTHHTPTCICGYIKESEEHSHYRYETAGSSKHYVYCKCGYCFGLEAHIVPVGGHPTVKFCMLCRERVRGTTSNTASPNGVNPSIRYITEAGSYVDANGVIYLVESDIELFLAGELDVYALVEQIGDLVTQ